jgi:hypothetical protein
VARSPTASQLLYTFAPTTPAGTTSAAPYTSSFAMPALEVRHIQWMVPNGPQGNLGWQITFSGQPFIPVNGGYIVTDNETSGWELDNQPETGAWGFSAYNTGTYSHTVYFRFLLDPLKGPDAPFDFGFLQPLDLSTLASDGD